MGFIWSKIISDIAKSVQIFNYSHSQNAGLRLAMLAITVSVRRGNFGKFVLSRFHVQFSIQLTHWQVTGQYSNGTLRTKSRNLSVWTQVERPKYYVYKKRPVSARIPVFSGFFKIYRCGTSCRFRKTKLYKNLLRIVGGVGKQRSIYGHTQRRGFIY